MCTAREMILPAAQKIKNNWNTMRNTAMEIYVQHFATITIHYFFENYKQRNAPCPVRNPKQLMRNADIIGLQP